MKQANMDVRNCGCICDIHESETEMHCFRDGKYASFLSVL